MHVNNLSGVWPVGHALGLLTGMWYTVEQDSLAKCSLQSSSCESYKLQRVYKYCQQAYWSWRPA